MALGQEKDYFNRHTRPVLRFKAQLCAETFDANIEAAFFVTLFSGASSSGPSAGEVRRYDVVSKKYDVLVTAGNSLGSGWFLTFGRTDPTTLEYK